MARHVKFRNDANATIMCVIDAQSIVGRIKEMHLPFEGFLEAVCRVAAIKALPTDTEVEAAACSVILRCFSCICLMNFMRKYWVIATNGTGRTAIFIMSRLIV